MRFVLIAVRSDGLARRHVCGVELRGGELALRLIGHLHTQVRAAETGLFARQRTQLYHAAQHNTGECRSISQQHEEAGAGGNDVHSGCCPPQSLNIRSKPKRTEREGDARARDTLSTYVAGGVVSQREKGGTYPYLRSRTGLWS